jgi:hypothetical protein
MILALIVIPAVYMFDQFCNQKPLRRISVATVVFQVTDSVALVQTAYSNKSPQNTTYFWSALLSPVYTIVLPLSMALGRQPFGSNQAGIFFWVLVAIMIKLPQVWDLVV